MEFKELYDRAMSVVNPRKLTDHTEAGFVGAAILSESGNVYLGVNIDSDCSVGFCAEHAAIAAMVTAGENVITKVVAVNADGKILPPCGRCREFMSQLSEKNMEAEVMVNENTILKIKDLLPFDWKAVK